MSERAQRAPSPPRTMFSASGRQRCPWPRTLVAAAVGLVGVLGLNFAAVVIGQAVARLMGIELDMPVAGTAGSPEIPVITAALGAAAVEVLLTGILAPIIEETIFRGIWFGLLRRRFGFWESAILPSLAFGMLHGIAAGPAVFLSGMLLCFLYDRTGRLSAPILVHVANNLLVIAWPVSAALVKSAGAIPAAALAVSAAAAAIYIIHRITEGLHCQND